MEEKKFDKFLEEYAKAQKKFSLPAFEEMQEDFDIEKISDKDGGFLIRDIRRVVAEKFVAYSHFFETLLNPTSPPMFVFSFLKNLSESDRKEIKELYKELSKMQIKTMKLDTIYNEKHETEFVKFAFGEWQKIKKRTLSLIETFEKEFEKNSVEKEKSYFG